jgi:hypothetical protein
MVYDKLSLDNYPRFIVYNYKLDFYPKDDSEMGKVLGFFCATHDYGNFMKDRIGLEIWIDVGGVEEYQVYAEVCEKELLNLRQVKEFLRNKVRLYNRVMKDLGFDIKFQGKIKLVTGILSLIEKVKEKDIEYISKNFSEYNNYFYNFGNGELHQYILKNFDSIEKIKKNLDFYYYLMLFTRPRAGVSLYETFMENDGDLDRAIRIIKSFKPKEINAKNFKEIIVSKLFN